MKEDWDNAKISNAYKGFKNKNNNECQGKERTHEKNKFDLKGEETHKKETENNNNNSVSDTWDTDIREPHSSFEFKDNNTSKCKVSLTHQEGTVNLPAKTLQDINTEKQNIEKIEQTEKTNIKAITDILVQHKIFVCINGRELFMEENGEYKQISFSLESEIMHLKALFKKYYIDSLNLADYKAILKELKCEPNIWVDSLEKNMDMQYNISFYSGENLTGVKGNFDDFVVRGQMKNKLKPFTEGIQLFVHECCKIIRDISIGSTELYCAYKDFMNEQSDFLLAKQNQFVPYIKDEYGLRGGSTGKIRLIIGICLIKNYS